MYNQVFKSIKKEQDAMTHKLINLAKNMLSNGNNKSLKNDMHQYMSRGRCFACKNKLTVYKIDNSGDRLKFYLICGHQVLIIPMSESKPYKTGTSGTRHVIIAEERIKVEKDGYTPKKEEDEISITNIFLEKAYKEYGDVKLLEQDSPIDTIASDQKGGEIKLQVTKMFSGDFWKKLNDCGEVDINALTIEEVKKLLREALKRKSHIDTKEKNDIILLISSFPGITQNYLQAILLDLKKDLLDIAYKEIWLVGPSPNLTFKLY